MNGDVENPRRYHVQDKILSIRHGSEANSSTNQYSSTGVCLIACAEIHPLVRTVWPNIWEFQTVEKDPHVETFHA